MLRLYAESGRFLQQESWNRAWLVVVICPNRQLDFGVVAPVREFVEQRLHCVIRLAAAAQQACGG